MDVGNMMELMADAFMTALTMAGPLLLISVLVGLVIAILQAATQVHEQTLTFVPKLIAIGLVLLLLGPWMIAQITDYTERLFEFIATYA
jgi:flagellar biosynthetic protein FliQ